MSPDTAHAAEKHCARNGIDSVEVCSGPQPGLVRLKVHTFFEIKEPIEKVCITGPRQARPLTVIGPPKTSNQDNRVLVVTVRDPGDSLPYTLKLVKKADSDDSHWDFDERYSHIDFHFRGGDRLPAGDCGAAESCRPPPAGAPRVEIDYLAKDYVSFRRVMLDRMAQTVPAWGDRLVPDLGLTLVEVLAYVADHLSYYQDAVATEAYLATARRRVSVRRHARLVDYPMHEGCNARAWVHLMVAEGNSLEIDPELIYFHTGPADPTAAATLPAPTAPDSVARAAGAGYVFFAPVVSRPSGRMGCKEGEADRVDGHAPRIRLTSKHNVIHFDVEGEGDVCLPRGATSAALKDKQLGLQPGDVLIFQEVKGPHTGQPADADRSRRHAVRLTRVVRDHDHHNGRVFVEWFEGDALPFPLCLRTPRFKEVSVALGNVVLVDQGYWRNEPLKPFESAPDESACGPAEKAPKEEAAAEVYDSCGKPRSEAPGGGEALVTRSDGRKTAWRYAPLQHGPLTHAAPFPDPRAVARVQAAYLAEYHDWLRRHGGGGAVTALMGLFLEQTMMGRPLAAWKTAVHFYDLLDEEIFDGADDLPEPSPWDGCAPRPGPSGEPSEDVDPLHPLAHGPASGALLQNPAEALPAVLLRSSRGGRRWVPRRDLLGHPGETSHCVVEIDDEGLAHVRFDDETPGRAPAPGEQVTVCCRVGNGAAGNVGAEQIIHWVWLDKTNPPAIEVCNPMPAVGGTDPEPVESVRLRAPTSFRDRLLRAITEKDYEDLAGRDPRVQKADCEILWANGRYLACVALDLKAETIARYGSHLSRVYQEIEADLNRYRRIGHDVCVRPAEMVPLDVKMVVGLRPGAERVPVELSLRAAVGSGVRADGRPGLLHPDNLTFGTPIAVSSLVAAAQAVDGVAWVAVTILRRWGDKKEELPARGVLEIGPRKIAQLDDVPQEPWRGRLLFHPPEGKP